MSEPPVDLSLKRSLDALGKTVREHPRVLLPAYYSGR